MPLMLVLRGFVARLALLLLLVVAPLLAAGQAGASPLRLPPAHSDAGQHDADAAAEPDAAEEVGVAARAAALRARRRATPAEERALAALRSPAPVADRRRAPARPPSPRAPPRPRLVRLLN